MTINRFPSIKWFALCPLWARAWGACAEPLYPHADADVHSPERRSTAGEVPAKTNTKRPSEASRWSSAGVSNNTTLERRHSTKYKSRDKSTVSNRTAMSAVEFVKPPHRCLTFCFVPPTPTHTLLTTFYVSYVSFFRICLCLPWWLWLTSTLKKHFAASS